MKNVIKKTVEEIVNDSIAFVSSDERKGLLAFKKVMTMIVGTSGLFNIIIEYSDWEIGFIGTFGGALEVHATTELKNERESYPKLKFRLVYAEHDGAITLFWE